MAKKKVTKKVAKKDNSIGIDEIVKDADAVLLVIDKGGHITVQNIKNVNNSIYAKGMLQSALDLYLIRPILNMINEVHKGVSSIKTSAKK